MIDHHTAANPPHRTMTRSEMLRALTRADHARAEQHPLMARLLTGRAGRDGYARYLAQLLHVHTTLEPLLRRLAANDRLFQGIVRPHHFRVPALCADLAFLGLPAIPSHHHVSPHAPLPATRLFCDRLNALAAEMPATLLGDLYVLEGSTNGGQIIARALRAALGLPDGTGTAYLDPHGPAQRERWKQFKAGLDALAVHPAQREAIVAAGNDAFRGIHDIMEDLTHNSE